MVSSGAGPADLLPNALDLCSESILSNYSAVRLLLVFVYSYKTSSWGIRVLER